MENEGCDGGWQSQERKDETGGGFGGKGAGVEGVREGERRW